MAYNLRPNSACSLPWSKNLHFRPLAPGLRLDIQGYVTQLELGFKKKVFIYPVSLNILGKYLKLTFH